MSISEIFRILPFESSIERMNFFLRDVWKQSKMVFAFFVLFILGTIWCTFSKIEITPFFLWAHYSDQQQSTGSFERVYIKVNGEILDLPKLSRPTREMIQLPTEYFVQLEECSYHSNTRHVLQRRLHGNCSNESLSSIERRLVNSEEDRDDYLNWLARYLEQVYDTKVNDLEIGKCKLVIQDDGSIQREEMEVIAKQSQR